MNIGVAILALFISLITALVVFRKSPRHATNVYFAMLVTLIGIYPVFNYLSINAETSSQALFWAKMILVVSIPQGPLLLFFAKSFPGPNFFFNKRFQLFIIAWIMLDIFLAALGLIFKEVTVSNGIVSIQPGPLVPAFGLLHVGTIIAGLVVLFRKYQRATIAKKQLAFVFYGILVSFSLTFLITFVLPLFLRTTLLLAISPLVLALSVATVAYAIIRHNLFDIRSTAARGLAYLLSLGTIGALYGVSAFGLTEFFGKYVGENVAQPVIYISFALVTALIFPFTKSFFDKITNKIFFHEAYDPQEFLNSLNQVLVEKIELEPLLTSSASIIKDALKATTATFVIRETAYLPVRVIGDVMAFNDDEHEKLNALSMSFGDKVISADRLDDNDQALNSFLLAIDTSVLIRLVATLKYPVEGLGYFLLGPKRNGEPYTDGDVELFEIIANELVIAIENGLRFEEIDKFNATLQDKIDVATKQLKRTNDKLKALDETKDEFISMASHQLRTPLTSVKGYLSMVIEGDAGELNEMQQKLLGQAFTSSQRMVYLIADLLNLSRLRTGKFVIDASPTNLATVISGELDQLREVFAAKNMKLVYDQPQDFPTLMMDETKIRQVLMNFIDNAIYYTPAGGSIEIALKDKKDSIEFTVKDNGIGVPKNEQQHLFGKFYRAGNARKARPDGTGLGLFMAKKVVIAQGGALIFTSKENKGSTFGFIFSKKKLALPVVVAPVALAAENINK